MKNISKLVKRVMGMTLSFTIALTTCGIPVGVSAADTPKVYILGDSTGCDYSASTDTTYYYKRVGFGTRLSDYLTDDVSVVNLAISGRSSKSFTSESNYTTYKNSVKAGDYVIIAFGHNDEKADDTSRYTEPLGDKDTEGSFKNSLYVNYIKPAVEAGATPIIATPVVRRTGSGSWSDSQLHKANGGDYAQAGRDLAAELNIPCIDNTKMTQDLYTQLGPDETLYLHAWTNSKSTSVDNTHLNNYGASYVAYLMSNSLKNSSCGLSAYVKSDISAPVKEQSLIVNPEYTEPEINTNDPTQEEMESSVFKTTRPWYGTAFGSLGGITKLVKNNVLVVNDISKRTNFEITEIDAATVNVRTGDVENSQSFGKLADSEEAFTLYYMPVDANSNFEISADAYINDILVNSQVSFGAICFDRIDIDKSNKTALYQYVSAGAAKYGDNAYVTFARNDGTLMTNNQTAYTPAKGDTVKVKLVKSGDNFKATYGDTTVNYTSKMSGTVYFGFYTTRNADIVFKNIAYSNEIVEDEPDESTSETVTETQTEVTTEATTNAMGAVTETQTEKTTQTVTEVTTEATTEATTQDVQYISDVVIEKYGESGIRFTAGISSLEYREVGFIFNYQGKEVRRSFDTVYSSIDGGISASDIGEKYVYSFVIDDVPQNAVIGVKPYIVGLDGSEYITNFPEDVSAWINNDGALLRAESVDETENDLEVSDIKKEDIILNDELISGSAVVAEIPEVA